MAKIRDLSEAIEAVNGAISEAESFISDIASDLENLISDMNRYDDGDGKDVLLDGIDNFKSQVEDVLRKIK